MVQTDSPGEGEGKYTISLAFSDTFFLLASILGEVGDDSPLGWLNYSKSP